MSDMAVRFRLAQLLAARPDGLSQAELARRAKLSNTAVNEIALNKTSRVTLATLNALCRELGVTPGELLEYVADVPAPKPRKRAA